MIESYRVFTELPCRISPSSGIYREMGVFAHVLFYVFCFFALTLDGEDAQGFGSPHEHESERGGEG